MRLRPFFCYYGGKWRVAPRYPRPEYGQIVEPFAGAAGYATTHAERSVLLVDKSPVIVGVWNYLIAASASEIMALPERVDHVDDVRACQEARWFVGFWLGKGRAHPGKLPSAWMRSGIRPDSMWGAAIRERIASQVGAIRHWKAQEGDYRDLAPREATWFVDPPYVGPAGREYKAQVADYPALGDWCRSLPGQRIVCENEGADWLPFRPFHTIKGAEGKGRSGVSREVVFTG